MEELKITLSLEEINIVLASLSELPYKTSTGVITKITTQAEAQLKAKRDLEVLQNTKTQKEDDK